MPPFGLCRKETGQAALFDTMPRPVKVWYSMIWYDMGYDMIWYGMVWYGVVWYEKEFTND